MTNKILMLSFLNSEAAKKSEKNWNDKARKLGLTVEVLNPLNSILQVSANKNGYDCLFNSEGERIYANSYDAFYPRISNVVKSLSVIRHLHLTQGKYTPQSATALLLCADKYATHQILSAKNVPTIETYFFANIERVGFVLDKFDFPFVLKTTFGSQGTGVETIKTERELYKVARWSNRTDMELIVQPYIETKKDPDNPDERSNDMRLIVVDGKVVAAMKRFAPPKKFKANLSSGGSAEAYKPTEEQKQIAINAAKALQLDIAGVDIIFDTINKKNMVIEVNGNFGLKIEEVTGTDIKTKVLQCVAKGKFKDTPLNSIYDHLDYGAANKKAFNNSNEVPKEKPKNENRQTTLIAKYDDFGYLNKEEKNEFLQWENLFIAGETKVKETFNLAVKEIYDYKNGSAKEKLKMYQDAARKQYNKGYNNNLRDWEEIKYKQFMDYMKWDCKYQLS